MAARIFRRPVCARAIVQHMVVASVPFLDPELRKVQNAEFDRFEGRLRRHLVEARKQGELRDSADIDLAAHQLLVLIDGLSAERVLYPGRVTAARQERMLNELLDSLRPRPA